MNDIISVTGGLQISATISDGAVKEIDLSELIGEGGVFASIRDRLGDPSGDPL
jgi:hypothetical protein